MMADSVESIVQQLAAEPSGHPVGASYVAQRAGIDVGEAYQRLEALAQHHDLERHFELVSPTTGKTLQAFRLGDPVPIGETYEPDDDGEQPFEITKSDIYISFSPTADLRVRLQRTHKKKRRTVVPLPPPEVVLQLRRDLEAVARAIRRSLDQEIRRIRSQIHGRRGTSKSKMGGR